MNPFIYEPRKIATKASANYVLGLYQSEIEQAMKIGQGIQETLNATVEVLANTHPNIEADLHLLIELARYAGHSDGRVQDLQVLSSQFRSALPWAIKKELGLV